MKGKVKNMRKELVLEVNKQRLIEKYNNVKVNGYNSKYRRGIKEII